jgi:hypothetical protein
MLFFGGRGKFDISFPVPHEASNSKDALRGAASAMTVQSGFVSSFAWMMNSTF